MSTENITPVPGGTTVRCGLRCKILAAMCAFNALVIAVFTADRWKDAEAENLRAVRQLMETYARELPEILPDTYLERACAPDAITAVEYLEVAAAIEDFCNESGIYDFSTYTWTDGSFRCTATDGTPEDINTGAAPHYWSRYDSASPQITRAWDENTTVLEPITAQSGAVFYTIFIPLVTESGNRFIATAGIPNEWVGLLLNDARRRTLAIGGFCFVLSLAVSFWASTRASRHIRWLATYTHELVGANFAAENDTPLRHAVERLPSVRRDEIGQLAAAFLTMEQQLQRHLRELTETVAAKERIQADLRMAGEIQASMLPQKYTCPDDRNRAEFHALMKPAKEAGGDLYDLIHLDDDHRLFVIADVSDKGMAAALFMAAAFTILRSHASAQVRDTPEVLLTQINRQLVEQNAMFQFVTVFLGIINLATGEVVYSDGGHNRPYHRPPGQPARMLPRGDGIALGVMPDAVYSRRTLRLQPGETLLLYTDGVTEAIAADESFYGEHRLETLLSQQPAEATAEEWVGAVTRDVATFTAGHVQSDDIAVLALRYLG